MQSLRNQLFAEINKLNDEDIKKLLDYLHQIKNNKSIQKESARLALLRLKELKGILKSAYPDYTSVELQHKAKEIW
uniref:DUF2281 domain-containing protein n=1 Tax=candidate division WOR-3 bacterium TaxID=2052148 RepID=A0A7C4TAL1_UNCW3